MLLWLIFSCLTAAVLVAVLRPAFGVNAESGSRPPADLAVYTDQLSDLERQLAQGQLDPGEFAALHDEVARRILRASAASKPAETAMRRQTIAPLVTAALVPILCLGFYAKLGSPNVPSQPFVTNVAKPINASAVELIAKVEARLAAHPEDVRGWDALAPVYFRLQRYSDAAGAYQNAMRLAGESMQRLTGFAEAFVLANDGLVLEPARIAYEKLAAADPNRLEPRFWLALAKEQDGKRDEAAAEYRAVLSAAPPDMPWRDVVEQRLAAVTKSSSSRRGPSASDVQAAAKFTPPEREAIIAGMVESLAARLRMDETDAEGWQKLIDSYMTLRKHELANAALSDARKALAGNKSALTALNEQARRLELRP